jgi:hypothetical protein
VIVRASLPGARGGSVLLSGTLDVPEGRVGVHPHGPETDVAVYSFLLGLHGARLRACAFNALWGCTPIDHPCDNRRRRCVFRFMRPRQPFVDRLLILEVASSGIIYI